ncbi:MAG: STAS domain protein [Methanosaeta sp. PtaB.Bin039]|nr:MAG: STAS domain protein [Methanosaeta sp. PtaB.Bin039]OPY46192.1 MAG: STAS domain protein [Methanosaeta sp. PtaU1.Bin028]HOT06628.1 STAS domain-containing protein [Methanotrichaceae archaeon]HQF16656.1 STAS domain-containing protein [Methanotrichaceae archaeon]HQI91332.1 STAS domain-containing protein [Methanotrichaceae archaeon]
MEIINTSIQGIPVLAVTGRIDAVTAKELDSAICGIIKEKAATMVLDLKGVDYISSSGLRVLMAAQKSLRPLRCEICLTCLQPMVREVMEATGIAGLFTIHPDRKEAITALLHT